MLTYWVGHKNFQNVSTDITFGWFLIRILITMFKKASKKVNEKKNKRICRDNRHRRAINHLLFLIQYLT